MFAKTLRHTTDALANGLMHDRLMRPNEHEHRVVSVERDRHGDWEVSLPDGRTCVACETLDDARRLAYLHAARILPCELVIRDAYHRVVDHEIIDCASALTSSSLAS